MMNRRKFFGLASAAAASATVPLVQSAIDHGAWPPTYWLAVKLPQPKNRPLKVPAGIGYWIERPTEAVECRHIGAGVYTASHRGMKLRALAERVDGKLICKYAVWDREWNVL